MKDFYKLRYGNITKDQLNDSKHEKFMMQFIEALKNMRPASIDAILIDLLDKNQ